LRVAPFDATAADTPRRLRGWGSPMVLVDGEDDAGEQAPIGPRCRLYQGADGRLRSVPPEALAVTALRRRAGWKPGRSSGL